MTMIIKEEGRSIVWCVTENRELTTEKLTNDMYNMVVLHAEHRDIIVSLSRRATCYHSRAMLVSVYWGYQIAWLYYYVDCSEL